MLEVEELDYVKNKSYILKKINLRLHSGKIYGLVGPNGSGKTSLLKNLAGIWKPSSGRVLWHGRNLHHGTRKEISRWVTFVPQSAVPAFDFTAEEIILMAEYAEETPLSAIERLERLEKVLREVGLEELRQRSVMQLSHGERQRVLLARALFTRAPLLLLDEPFASLDLKHSLRLASQLKFLTHSSHVILLALHDFSLAQDLCDEIILLDQGACVSVGGFDEVLSHKRFESIFGVIPQEERMRKGFALAE